MLLTITTTHKPATDLGYLLYKHPGKLQSFEISSGQVHIFYPEASEEKSTVALLLDIDSVGLVRNSKGPSGEGFALENYVNDRPYVASSFMSAAIAKAFGTAMNGTCKDKPELPEVKMPFEVTIQVLPSRGGEKFLRSLFEPLGYEVEAVQLVLDASYPEWGNSRYFSVTLRNTIRLKDLLSQLYLLIPVLDNDKHYWISEHEIQKLEEKGAGWLQEHPLKEQIIKRYLKNLGRYTKVALANLLKDEPEKADLEESPEESDTDEKPEKVSLHNQRLHKALEEIKLSGAERVLDLGCGDGKLMRLLLREKQFTEIAGMDVSWRSLEIAKDKLNIDRIPEKQKQRIKLFQGSLTYRDSRLKEYDAAAVVEVIEHLDPGRLEAFEKVLFESAKPATVVITTPNAEYNSKYESLTAGSFRHSDHRFEWNRPEFETWCSRVAEKYNYTVTFAPVGDWDESVGAPSQMAVFKING
jgi:3' terminal RNA ribose 2'-O-methyltransferase Hen1